jgi:hypothetical protein
MLANRALAGANPYEQPVDVEELFSAVELLSSRRTHEVAPFVASWHPGVEAMDGHALWPLFDHSFARAVEGARSPRLPPQFGNLIQKAIESVTGPGDGSVYRHVSEEMTRALRRLVHIADGPGQTVSDAVSYLRPICDLAGSQGLLTIATLNYDRSIELVCESSGVTVETGISSWSGRGSWDWPDHGVRLLKLHGSIDWLLRRVASGPRQLPHAVIGVDDHPKDYAELPAVVFGQRGKLRAHGPFLELLAQFREDLDEADQLVVIGYSFRDDHVNEYIIRWANASQHRRIIGSCDAFVGA